MRPPTTKYLYNVQDEIFKLIELYRQMQTYARTESQITRINKRVSSLLKQYNEVDRLIDKLLEGKSHD